MEEIEYIEISERDMEYIARSEAIENALLADIGNLNESEKALSPNTKEQ